MNLNSLIYWSKNQFGNLPWRQQRNLYRTLVSEIMLQQTTVSTVLNHYNRFLNLYPTLDSLAVATEEELTIAWKGLGYYRRAKNLLKAAQFIMKEYEGSIPLQFEQLCQIPGIGPYTANALLSIGNDQRALSLDTNLTRVIARLYGIHESKGPKLNKMIESDFNKGTIFPNETRYRQMNEALMDLGRTICQASKAHCLHCPLTQSCLAFKNGTQDLIPIREKKSLKNTQLSLNLARFYLEKNGKVLVKKREQGQWLEGQWELPTAIVQGQDPTCKQYPWYQDQNLEKAHFILKSSITKYKITNSVYVIKRKNELPENLQTDRYEWVQKNEGYNFSSVTLKIFKQISPINIF